MAVEYRARSLGTALRYKGREGMWTWILHRATGLGVLFFLVAHVIDTGIIIYRPDWYDHALGLYRHPVFRIAELFIFFGVLFHAVNGTRIVIQDFWPRVMERHRQLAVAGAAIVVVASVGGYRAFLALSFNEAKAGSLGLRPGATHLTLLALIALAIVSSFQAVGTLLVFGLLVGFTSN